MYDCGKSESLRMNSRKVLLLQVGTSDFQDWEKQHGLIPQGGVVFINFGWEQYYPERKAFLGI